MRDPYKQLIGLWDLPKITQTIAAGLFDGAKIFVFEVNYSDLSQGILPLMRGFWGECQLQENCYTTEFRSLSQVLQQTIGELYSTTCRAQLGDLRCGVKVADMTVEGVVSEVKNKACFNAEGFDEPTQTFQYGVLTWQQGKNAGLSMEVKSFFTEHKTHATAEAEKTEEKMEEKEKNNTAANDQNAEFHLVQPMPYLIEVGGLFSVYPGCNYSLLTCKNQFHNVVNFRGEPFIPGVDHMLKIP